MSAPATALRSLARNGERFFLAEKNVTGAFMFRLYLAVWTIFYWAPRFEHAWELYCRPVLRQASATALSFAVPPLWLAQAAIGGLLLCLVMFAISQKPRIWHLLLLVPLTFLVELDTLMDRAYGRLAYIQWLLLFLAPYDRLFSKHGQIMKATKLGTRLLQLQWAAVYLFTVPSKLSYGKGWLDGTTLWSYLHANKHGEWLLSYWIDVPVWATQILGLLVLAMELFVAIGIFIPKTRRLAMLACIALHLGMASMLRVTVLFPLLMWGHLLLFVSDAEWAWLFRRLHISVTVKEPEAETGVEPSGSDKATTLAHR